VNSDDARRALRDSMRDRRNQLPPRARLRAAESMVLQLRKLDFFARPGRVAGYWAVRGELPLHALLAPRPAFDYCLPCLEPDSRLSFAAWLPGAALRENRYGIPEPDVEASARLAPDALDVVLVPLLAFDRRGARLGSGGGYYDRSFAFLRDAARPARPLLVGVAYAFQEIENLPVAEWDIALDYVATDAELIACAADTAPAGFPETP
jgi:5-formyltetrahydrofolate cyclo-ligase